MNQKIKKICVIGAGASGITAIKSCLEENFDVICYDKSDDLGGLWRYKESYTEGLASVAYSTTINSSKEMSAFSDFPPPKNFANFMHHSSMFAYFQMYAKKFNLKNFIKFEHEVIQLKPNSDYSTTGKWVCVIKSLKDSTKFEQVFDGVMVCTGHHFKPHLPTFIGQDKFKGKIIHTHSYKKPNEFENKTVVIIGIGNSGGDAAVDLSTVAKKVYLSTRRGTWVLQRVGRKGKPFDGNFLRRCLNIFLNIFPYYITSMFLEYVVNSYFDHDLYGLKPKNRLLSQHPFVNDVLPVRLLSGAIILKNNVKEITENGVIFYGENEVTLCDAIIMATGYDISYSFLDESLIWSKEKKIELYKFVFPPKLQHPHTIALIGLVQAYGPAIPISEQQCRWYVQLMKGTCKLPSLKKMMSDILKKREEMKKRYYDVERHIIQVDWINFMDELTQEFGAKPNLLKYAFTDPKLWWNLFFNPCAPYQYRLNGPHSWDGARQAILELNKRIETSIQTRTMNKS